MQTIPALRLGEVKVNLVFGAATTAVTETLRLGLQGAMIHSIYVTTPTWTDAVTGTLTVYNSAGHLLNTYGSGATIARGATTAFQQCWDTPLPDGAYITLTLSAVPNGTGGTAVVEIYTLGA
jgi:hypothetical protein